MSLQVWLPLNGTLENQGLSNLNFSITDNVVVNNNGKIGKCYYNESPTFKIGQIISDNSINLGINQSMFCWVKFNTLCSASSLTGLVSQHNPTDQTNMGLNIRYVSETTGYLTVSTGTGSARTYNRYYGITLLQAETWYHVGYTYDGTTIKLYVNGQLDKTYTFVNQLCTNEKIVLFAWKANEATANYRLNGYLNDVRIYDHCLSAKEVEEISKGLVLHYKLDNNGLGNPNLLLDTNAPSLTKVNADYNRYIESSSSGTYTITWETIPDPPAPGIINGVRESVSAVSSFHSVVWYSGSLVNVIVGNTYTMSCYVKIISGSDLLFTFQYGKSPYVADTQTLINDHEWHQYSWTFVPNDSAAADGTTRIYPGGLKAIGEVLICGWKLEEGDQATPWCLHDEEMPEGYRTKIYDSSGYNNDANITGTLISSNNSIRYNLSTFQDNGLTNYIKTKEKLYLPTDACTMSIWIKSTNTTPKGNYHIPFNAYTSAATYELSVHKTGYFRSGLYVDGTRKIANCTTNILDGNWHMITTTYDGTNIKRYVDTVVESTTEASGALTSPMDFVFGRYGTSTTYSSNDMYYNDARFYATALTQKQIEELYNTSMSIDKEGNILAREVKE